MDFSSGLNNHLFFINSPELANFRAASACLHFFFFLFFSFFFPYLENCRRRFGKPNAAKSGLPGGRFSGPKFKSGRFQDPPGDFSLLKKGPPEFGRFWAILGPPGRYLTFEKRPNKIWAILGNFRPSWLYFQKRPNQNWVILDNFGVNLTQFLSNFNFH